MSTGRQVNKTATGSERLNDSGDKKSAGARPHEPRSTSGFVICRDGSVDPAIAGGHQAIPCVQQGQPRTFVDRKPGRLHELFQRLGARPACRSQGFPAPPTSQFETGRQKVEIDRTHLVGDERQRIAGLVDEALAIALPSP